MLCVAVSQNRGLLLRQARFCAWSPLVLSLRPYAYRRCLPLRTLTSLCRSASLLRTSTLEISLSTGRLFGNGFWYGRGFRFRFHATLQRVTKCDADFRKNLYVNVALIVVNFPGHAFDALLLSPFRGTELRVFRCSNEMRFGGPCQDAGEGFGFQEESKVVAPT